MEQVKKTPVALVGLAWLFVGLPWGWGVTQLWKNAQKLFQSSPAVSAPAATLQQQPRLLPRAASKRP
jgi:hypothetical protein